METIQTDELDTEFIDIDEEGDTGIADEVLTIEEATEYIADTIAQYGRPAWIAEVPVTIRQMVPNSIIAGFLATAKASEGWGSPRDGRDTIIAWAKDNIFALVTVKELAEIGGISEATVRTLLGERPDIFRKSDGRKYEVRDPQADRAADKR